MRLKYTSFATVVVLAVSGTALAATTIRHSLTTTMSGTSHLTPGGKLTLITTHRKAGDRLGVTIHYDVQVRSKTVLAFAAHPCRSTSCTGQSTSRITLGPGTRHVKFHGSVPFVLRPSREACVYAQLRDLGPKARTPGKVVRNGSSKGVSLCQKR
ncbi:MAG: hypothetical protein QOC95_558 [Thermoleophilaceae bacterium]|nr:hypothetical protein [Thermoleophilaceae bacterium]